MLKAHFAKKKALITIISSFAYQDIPGDHWCRSWECVLYYGRVHDPLGEMAVWPSKRCEGKYSWRLCSERPIQREVDRYKLWWQLEILLWRWENISAFKTLQNFQILHWLIHFFFKSAPRMHINGVEEDSEALIDDNADTCVNLTGSDGCTVDRVRNIYLQYFTYSRQGTESVHNV